MSVYLRLLGLVAFSAVCSCTITQIDDDDDGGAGYGGGGSGGTGAVGGGAGQAGSAGTGGDTGDASVDAEPEASAGTAGAGGQDANPCPVVDPAADDDGDGFSHNDGDCNDCDALVNPGAYDYAGDGIDNDCSGGVDDEVTDCDDGLPVDESDPLSAAKAMDICRVQEGNSWGLVSAAWVFPDGTTASQPPYGCGSEGDPPNAESHGVLDGFGDNVAPKVGNRMLALSSGAARDGVYPVDTGESPHDAKMCTASLTPDGFPIDSPSCSTQTADDNIANDAIALELKIKVPTNAKSFAFGFDFYTYEWPTFYCSAYNDFFVALLWSNAALTPANHNISFDAQNNPVSVNNAFVEVCEAQQVDEVYFPCNKGTDELMGTGFEGHAATSWLLTEATVEPGETITLRFAIWDMADEILDSTALIDGFRWDPEEKGGPSTSPMP